MVAVANLVVGVALSATVSSVVSLPVRSSRRSIQLWLVGAPAAAMGVAFLVRLALLALTALARTKFHFDLQIIGQEAALVAWSLASGKGFANPFPHYEAATGWLAPVFPALWSIGYRFFNPEVSAGGLYYCQIMNSAFSALTCWPIFWLGKRVFSARIGAASAWTWAFLPLAILFPLEWTWDQSLSALVLACLVCATYKIRDRRADSLAWSGYGCLWGFAALVNPTLCVMLPCFFAWIALSRAKASAPFGAPLLRTALLFFLVVLPWSVRNYYQLDGWVFVKSNFGLELWLGNNAGVPADNVYANELNPMTNRPELLQLALSGEPGYMRTKQRAAIAFIRSNPAVFAKLVFRRAVDTWTGWYDSHIDKWVVALHGSSAWVSFCAIFSILAAMGMILALRQNSCDVLPLALCVVIFPVPYYITHSSLRYRHPIDPFLTTFTVYAVAAIYAYFQRAEAQAAAE